MIDWGLVLLEVGINIPPYKQEFNIVCPLHNDRVASCAINIDKGVWICYAGCGGGSIRSLLLEMGVSRLTIDKEIYKAQGKIFDRTIFDTKEEKETELYQLKGDAGRIPNWALQDREFDIKVLARWGCRLGDENSLVIPAHTVDGKIVGSITRQVVREPKYLYSKGLPKSRILFGAERIKEPVSFICVVEGALDAIWLDQHGYHAVALLGMSISKNQCELLKKLRTSEIVISTDSDGPGREAAKAVATCIGRSFVVSYTELPDGAKDVQDLRNEDVLHQVIKNRSYW